MKKTLILLRFPAPTAVGGSPVRTRASVLFGATVASFLLYGILTLFCHWLLQQPAVYSAADRWLKTYEVVTHPDESWEAVRVAQPYTAPNDSNMLAWDAAHYHLISQHLYDPQVVWVGNLAFYPLFPLMWRATGVGPVGISLINWLLFALGMGLMVLLFRGLLQWWQLALLFAMPYLVIYMIPYSEALFFAAIALGLFGLCRDRYWLYFLGFFFAGMTRAAGNIMLVAWAIVDLLDFLYTKSSWRALLRNLLRHLSPIVLAVGAVVVVQRLSGAEHWFDYVSAQQYWGKSLSLPTWPLTDWSAEGRSVTQPLVFIFYLPMLVWLAVSLFKSLRAKESQPFDLRCALRHLSVLFLVGNITLALLTQHGCLYSQARLLTCTPFFVFLLFDSVSRPHPRWFNLLLLSCMLVAAVLCLSMFSKADMLGCWLVFVGAAVVFFHRRMPRWLTYALLVLLVLLSIFWTAYLFNCFLNGGWIFT